MNPKARKQFAQHWLRSEKVLQKIVTAAKLQQSDRLLEIGPGTGILTRRLLPAVESVLAVEIDRDLCELLVKKLGNNDNFLLLQGDFLSLDLTNQLSEFPNFQKLNKVVANIPYHITGPIIQKLIGTIAQPALPGFELIVLLVQKEVAQRLYAKPGSKAFGALSVRVQYLAECELICDVPSVAFYPPPKVDSAVVRLHPRVVEPPADNPKHLEMLLKLGFSSKRKMLRNNLKSVVKVINQASSVELDLTNLLEQLEVNPQARAEELSVAQWVALSNTLAPKS
ncbi:MAG: 16S rRNA (adenine(1518)-N(6)/adenine(1519)-N(6))-dimethyltransferase RsmA [Symploca sp. SIO3C6]|uniref:Ribosomal RNA small subunit methyltransferase A n=1 Tax=Symploca sp. SIO1C4 TaxID=2607765 RepID=A0A6B3NHY0_9CYAN|nr:16S rRNA (adenine(1518)-N(6)/adenine(1519)-N(6))-dimethyltransferase RsmA [Symploca sp. SIO3C6]NER30465.1 16S rRNA (adenine(1518)-N(6)/adenine(1519)-N(6))-dimethyltransferase RsmA [Symploca sp. SIO1C4]